MCEVKSRVQKKSDAFLSQMISESEKADESKSRKNRKNVGVEARTRSRGLQPKCSLELAQGLSCSLTRSPGIPGARADCGGPLWTKNQQLQLHLPWCPTVEVALGLLYTLKHFQVKSSTTVPLPGSQKRTTEAFLGVCVYAKGGVDHSRYETCPWGVQRRTGA